MARDMRRDRVTPLMAVLVAMAVRVGVGVGVLVVRAVGG